MSVHTISGFNLTHVGFQIIQFYLFGLCLIMQQGNGLSCSCMGSFFHPQQKLFLARKKEPEDIDNYSSRKSNKSTEFKNQSELKQKKSLKKRTLSNFSVETPPSPLTYSQPSDSDLKINMNHQDPMSRKDYSYSKTNESPINQAKIMYSNGGNAKNIEEVWKYKSYNTFWQQKNYQPTTPVILPQTFPHHSIQTPPTKKFQADFRNAQYLQSQNHQFYGNFSPKKEPAQKQEQKHIQKIHFLSKDAHKEAQSWMTMKDQEVLIEQFDSFFKNKKEHQSFTNLTHPNKSFSRPKEQQTFKRPQKPQLMGRFAESDDQACSQSPPSEVIGKGFDSTLYDFWQMQQGNNAKETLASRSTNTKLSQFNRNQGEDRTKLQFGTVNSFKSYQYL